MNNLTLLLIRLAFTFSLLVGARLPAESPAEPPPQPEPESVPAYRVSGGKQWRQK